MLIQKKKMAGVSIVDVVLATTVLLFVSYAGLSVVSSSAVNTATLSKKVTLSDDLDDRVGEYVILKKVVGSGSIFNDTSSGSIVFSETDITADVAPNDHGYIIYEFKATNSDGMEVSQRALKRS